MPAASISLKSYLKRFIKLNGRQCVSGHFQRAEHIESIMLGNFCYVLFSKIEIQWWSGTKGDCDFWISDLVKNPDGTHI